MMVQMKKVPSQDEFAVDQETILSLSHLSEQEKLASTRVPGVRTVLIVMSSRGQAFDRDAVRHQVLMAYPEVAVFFKNTSGKALGAEAPEQIDLLIDFTGPGQRQGLFYAVKLRRRVRVAIGRNAGLFRKQLYDRVFDEKANIAKLPSDLLERERFVQREVLRLAGIVSVQQGEILRDHSYSIALSLPPLAVKN